MITSPACNRNMPDVLGFQETPLNQDRPNVAHLESSLSRTMECARENKRLATPLMLSHCQNEGASNNSMTNAVVSLRKAFR